MNKMNLEVNLPVSVFREGEYYIAYTPSLDISTYAKSFDKVKERFEELVQIFLQELVESKKVDEVLSDLGWKKDKKEWVPPLLISQESQTFSVPLTS